MILRKETIWKAVKIKKRKWKRMREKGRILKNLDWTKKMAASKSKGKRGVFEIFADVIKIKENGLC